jgi:phosphoribosylformylglycinamidine synthase
VGARVRLERLAAPSRTSTAGLLFGESPSRLLVSVPRQRRERFLALIDGLDGAAIGEVSGDRRLHVSRHGRRILRVEVERLAAAWSTGPAGGGS